MGNRPLKISTFSGRNANKDGHTARPTGGFFKTPYILLQFCVLATVGEGEMTPPLNNRGASYENQHKNGRVCSTLGGFRVLVTGHRGFQEEVSFCFMTPQPQRRTQILCKVFENFSNRVSANQKKTVCSKRVDLKIKGPKIAPPKFSALTRLNQNLT